MEDKKECFGEFNTDDCCCCSVAVECYEERNNRLMDMLASR